MEFAASGDHHDLGVGGEIPSKETGCGCQQFLSGFQSGCPVGCKVGDIFDVEAVWCDQIGGPAEKVLRLRGGNLTDRGETVRLAGRYRLHRALGDDVVGARLPLWRNMLHRRVDVHSVGCQRSSERRGVRGEDGADLRRPFLETEKAGPRHPFVELGDRPHSLGLHNEVVEGFDHLACRIAEHDRFHIVPAPGDGVDAVVLPESEEELVLVVLFAEADEDRFRPAWHLPAAEAARNFLDGHPFADVVPAIFVRLLEIGVRLEVRTEDEITFAEELRRLGEFARDHGMDPADLVADLPAYLKKIVILRLCHDFSPFFVRICRDKSSIMFI